VAISRLTAATGAFLGMATQPTSNRIATRVALPRSFVRRRMLKWMLNAKLTDDEERGKDARLGSRM